MAKVIEIDRNVKGALSLWLDVRELSWSVADYRPGQYLLLTVYFDGRYQSRCFSISEYDQEAEKIKLGMRINPEGLVTNFMAECFKVGDEVQLTEPKGEFVLPKDAKNVLMVAGGSGITPFSAILQQQKQEASDAQAKNIDLLYFSPSQEATLQHDFINRCNDALESLSLTQIFTEQEKQYFDQALLEKLGLDIQSYDTVMVCGPEAMKRSVKALAVNENSGVNFMSEDFHTSFDSEEVNNEVSIHFLQTKHEVENSAVTILESAENEGLELLSGCRQGVCHMCACEKVSGSVKNLITGEVSHLPNETIQLCVSKALSDVELNR